MKEIKISTEYIKLDQFMKFTGLAENGGQAKFLISSEDVYVNGEIEKRRGRKLRLGDTVRLGEEEYIVK